MAIKSSQLAIDDSPSVLIATGSSRPEKSYVVIDNKGTNPVYLGYVFVTSATGFAVAATDPPVTIILPQGENLYGICAAAETCTVHVLQTGG
jgi:hypothetical protein